MKIIVINSVTLELSTLPHLLSCDSALLIKLSLWKFALHRHSPDLPHFGVRHNFLKLQKLAWKSKAVLNIGYIML